MGKGAPDVCGVDARNLGRVTGRTNRKLLSQRFDLLLRGLRHEQTNAAQFFVSENDLLALIAVFDVTEA
jgi:hypothetical protein